MPEEPQQPEPHPKASGIPCDTCHTILHWSERGGVLLCGRCDYPSPLSGGRFMPGDQLGNPPT